MQEPLANPTFEVVRSPLGHWTVQEGTTQECMHPWLEPLDEARKLYAEQSTIGERLEASERLVVWDVGLGLGANATAALEIAEPNAQGHLSLISFERDLTALQVAKSSGNFPWLDHPRVDGLLKHRQWESKGVHWKCLVGDFRETFLNAPDPDVIFFDPFSKKTNPELWEGDLMRSLALRLRNNGRWITYSTSRAFRLELLQAGLWVCRGIGVGARPQSTIAIRLESSLDLPTDLRPLDLPWLLAFNVGEVPDLRRHPQFH